MTIDLINLSEIEWMLFKKLPDQPGFVTFDRNLTIKQFADEIKARLPDAIRRRLDYFGPPPMPSKYAGLDEQISPDATGENARNIDLTTHWARGSNEGFYNSVYAVAPYNRPGRRLIWSAKTFEAKAAVALDLCLHCWISGSSDGQEHDARQILASIDFD